MRHIDTADLRGFKGMLDRAGAVPGGLASVEAQARRKISGGG